MLRRSCIFRHLISTLPRVQSASSHSRIGTGSCAMSVCYSVCDRLKLEQLLCVSFPDRVVA